MRWGHDLRRTLAQIAAVLAGVFCMVLLQPHEGLLQLVGMLVILGLLVSVLWHFARQG